MFPVLKKRCYLKNTTKKTQKENLHQPRCSNIQKFDIANIEGIPRVSIMGIPKGTQFQPPQETRH